MEKMISPNGVKANMCCASCLYLDYMLDIGFRIKRYCKKKSQPVIPGGKCHYYVMAEFFQERGYKVIKK